MTEGLSLAAAAAECDVHRQRVYEWEKRHPDFADTIMLARVKRLAFLERRLLRAGSGYEVTSSIFALKNAAPEDWRDSHDHRHSGPNGGAIPLAAFTPEMLSSLTDEELDNLDRTLQKLGLGGSGRGREAEEGSAEEA